MSFIVSRTIGATGVFSTPQLWADGAPANLITAEKSAAGTFAVTTFIQGENLTFVGSGATGKFLDTDSTGPGTGTYIAYGLTTGNPAASDVVTGDTSGATCVLSSGTPIDTGCIWKGLCQNQEFTDGVTYVLNITGITAAVNTAFPWITTAPGASFRDHVDRLYNPLKYDASKGCGFSGTSTLATVRCNVTGARVENLQLKATDPLADAIFSFGFVAHYFGLLAEASFTDTTANHGVIGMASQGGIIHNCVAIQLAEAANQIVGVSSSPAIVTNCTFVAAADLTVAPTNVLRVTGASKFTNCSLFAGDATKAIASGGTPTFANCYSDISGTAGVTQTPYAAEFEGNTVAARDYRLKAGAVQIDAGIPVTYAEDIVGTPRPRGAQWDVGAWEFVAPAPVGWLRG